MEGGYSQSVFSCWERGCKIRFPPFQPSGLGLHQIGYFASGTNQNLMRQRMAKPSLNAFNCLIPQPARKCVLIPLIFAVKEKLL